MYKIRITTLEKEEILDKSYASYEDVVNGLCDVRIKIIDNLRKFCNTENVDFNFKQDIKNDYYFELTYWYIDHTKYKNKTSEEMFLRADVINKYTLFLENFLPKIVIMLVGGFFIIRGILTYI